MDGYLTRVKEKLKSKWTPTGDCVNVTKQGARRYDGRGEEEEAITTGQGCREGGIEGNNGIAWSCELPTSPLDTPPNRV
jgi:hypothetical protein